MKMFPRIPRHLPFLALLALTAGLPRAASAQSDLDTSQAQAFLGSWSIAFESPQGAFVVSLEITDSAGKVAATMSDDFNGSQEITNISRSEENLVLRYEIDAQGQMAPVALTLAPNGDALDATMDFADGMFVMEGRATK